MIIKLSAFRSKAHHLLKRAGALSSILLASAVSSASVGFAQQHSLKNNHRFTKEHVLGTDLEVQLIADDAQIAQEAFKEAMSELERLEAIFSSYKHDSECSKLSKNKLRTPISTSPELQQALKIAQHAGVISDGRFTIFSNHLSKAWKDAATTQVKPTPATLRTICAQISEAQKQVTVDREHLTVTLGSATDSLTLSFDAFAKGMIIDACLESLTNTRGVHSAMVNIGGDIACGGNGQKWPVNIRTAHLKAPIKNTSLSNQAIATSGHYHRFNSIGGQQYSHIIDATTGMPVTKVASSTVIAPTAVEADMLATVICLMSPEAALKLINGRENCHAIIVGENHKTYHSQQWPFEKKDTPENPASVAISFEQVFSEKGKKSDRHYTVIWVENERGEKVKDIMLWHKMKKRKYLKTLRTWYSKGGKTDSKNLEFLKTISQATKKAGSYSASWDHTGNDGNTLPQGVYTINLEVNREDGPRKESPTHSSIQIDTRKSTFKHTADSQPEIPSFKVTR